MSNNKNKSENKTKILAIGDIHGDRSLVKKLSEKVIKENIDLVIIVGDLTLAEMSIKNLIGPFTKAKKPVLIIPGNHETPETIDLLTKTYNNLINIHGRYYIKNNLGFFGAGGGDVGIYVLKDEDVFELLKKGHEKIKNLEKKVMVTHMHPAGSKAEFSGFKGFKSIKKAIESFKPDILLTAHIHEAGGIEEMIGKTKVINVSRREKILEI